MPMKLNVGANKKLGEANFGSRGGSVNLEIELDSGLLQEPEKLKEKIRQLFGLVRSSLNEELNGGASHGHAENGNGNRASPANGNGASSDKPRPATQSQVRALNAIAKSQRLDLTQFLRDHFQVRKAEELSIKEASEAIDQLKSSNS